MKIFAISTVPSTAPLAFSSPKGRRRSTRRSSRRSRTRNATRARRCRRVPRRSEAHGRSTAATAASCRTRCQARIRLSIILASAVTKTRTAVIRRGKGRRSGVCVRSCLEIDQKFADQKFADRIGRNPHNTCSSRSAGRSRPYRALQELEDVERNRGALSDSAAARRGSRHPCHRFPTRFDPALTFRAPL